MSSYNKFPALFQRWRVFNEVYRFCCMLCKVYYILTWCNLTVYPRCWKKCKKLLTCEVTMHFSTGQLRTTFTTTGI